ncbi:MAG: type III-B CRISPR module RAMP protein Cmr6 [Thiotrichales bacterium]|nr:type III-B CRISPR module RAMP protein Cmr6 [Thiotrichales bacterium]
MDGLIARQSELRAMVAPPSLLHLEARSIAPFATGLGSEHPLENGFAFLNPYGLPYLPGSSVKGVVRRAAEELAHKEFSRMSDEPSEWSLPDVWRLFGFERWPRPKDRVAREPWDEWVGGFDVGKVEIDDYLEAVLPPGIDGTDLQKRMNESENDRHRLHLLLDEPTLHARGALDFWDVVPGIAGDRLKVEIMTPHQSHYYTGVPHQGSATPHDSGSPNPIGFLTVPPGSEFAFHVRCDVPRLKRIAPRLAEDGRWKTLVKAAFEHAFEWLGFGAKTAVGYGAMEPDRQAEIAAREREEREAARRAEEEKERRRIAAEQAEVERRAAEEAARKAEFDALPESRKRFIQVEGLLNEITASGRLDENHRNQLKSEANRLVEQAAFWSDADERREAAEILERLYGLIGWHDPGRNRKQREKQTRKRRDAIARVRRGENGAIS